MSDYTRGPWSTFGQTVFSDKGYICSLPADEDGKLAEAYANAQLISAAPELLDALKSLVGFIWGLDPADTSDGCYTDDPKEQKARAAIEKAIWTA